MTELEFCKHWLSEVESLHPNFPWLLPARWWGEPQPEASWCEKAGNWPVSSTWLEVSVEKCSECVVFFFGTPYPLTGFHLYLYT